MELTDKDEGLKKLVTSKTTTLGLGPEVPHSSEVLKNIITGETGFEKEHSEETLKDFEKVMINNVFKWVQKSEYLNLFSRYLLCLSKLLYNDYHESKKTGFWFVLGDRSEFDDAPQTAFRKLRFTDIKTMKIPILNNNKEEELKMMNKDLMMKAKLLSKEHFPWFENGRNAMLWDINSRILAQIEGEEPQPFPVGLVSLKQITWKQYFNNVNYNYDKMDIPNCVVFEVNDELPIVRVWGIYKSEINSKKDEKELKIVELLRFQDGEWLEIGSENRKKQIKEALSNLKINIGNPNQQEEILDITLTIANDLNRGGTIIILDNCDSCDVFKPIGKPWEIDRKTNGDIISLISHDGATVKILNSDDWEYRRLLTSSGITKSAIDNLFKHVEHNYELMCEKDITPDNEFCPLSFVGTRRWSAAIASLHDKVKAVIVISQDGGVTIWANEASSFESAKALRCELSGEISLYIPSENKYNFWNSKKRNFKPIKKEE